jgi:LacI family transcriptional regulator
MRNGDRPVTLKDIADRCGVTKMTVSRALRGDTANTSEATIELVQRVARDMGYDPSHHAAARRLALSKTGQQVLNRVIGLLFFHKGFVGTNYFNSLFHGILDAMLEEDYQVQTADTWNLIQTGVLPVTYRKGDLDGALTIATGGYEWDATFQLLRNEIGFRNRPIVDLVSHVNDCSAVYGDHLQAGYLTMKHLLDLGHRHVMIPFAYSPSATNVHGLRASGYEKAYQEINLDPLEYLRPSFWNTNDYEQSRKRLVIEIQRHKEVTALIARNDWEAEMMYTALTSAGIRIPEDISFISYDDTNQILNSAKDNILTTVRLPLYDIGFHGAKLLVRRIHGDEPEDRDIVLPVELIVRSSTAPPSR